MVGGASEGGWWWWWVSCENLTEKIDPLVPAKYENEGLKEWDLGGQKICQKLLKIEEDDDALTCLSVNIMEVATL
jgi:hypothetical protein